MDNEVEKARSAISSYFVIGLLLSILGGIIIGATWPGEEAASFGGVKETGSTGGTIAGIVIAWLGSCAIAVAIIGHGVRFGIQASGPGRAEIGGPADRTAQPDA